jgi:uncharacterized protein (DUF362 family)
MNSSDLSVVIESVKNKKYPQRVPFDPPQKYPEVPFEGTDPENEVYFAVRQLFYRLGLDTQNFGKPEWNPLGAMVRPGMTVFIKPNTVVHEHEEKKDVFSVIVHASVLRPVLDYVVIALKSEGRIIVGDSQLIHSHFDKAMKVSGIEGLLDWYRKKTKIPIECIDLRTHRGVRTYLYGKWGRVPVMQDPRGYQFVDLGDKSCFHGIDPKRLRIAIASHKNMLRHHSEGLHEYQFPKSFLASDVVISIPKLKTHRRTAVTLALKNFMGLPSFKDSLPHFITGAPEEGGDQYIHPSKRKDIVTWLHDEIQTNPYVPVKFVLAVVKKLLWNSYKLVPFKDDVYEAMWHGNDTLWRTLFDLNRIAAYADKEGKMQTTPQRQILYLIDGVIAGEKNGPLSPDPVKAGVMLASMNPFAIDAVGATLMGFDYNRIPLISKGFDQTCHSYCLFQGNADDIRVVQNSSEMSLKDYRQIEHLHFVPHPGWKGHVELDQSNA